MSKTATLASHGAGRGLRFLFAPQLFGRGSLQPVKGILLGFVQLIAQFMATAELIPSTHRALRPTCAADARLGEVIALAYSTLRKPGTRLDQYVVFGGVITLFALLGLLTVYTLAGMLLGTAHAAITITFSFAACNTAGTFFTSGCGDNDMAQQWINALLLADSSAWWLGQTNFISPQMQAGLGAMFQTYSYAILVLAGFLVLYHLVIVVAGTAHEGRLGGKGMNQIWAPIRLVAAVGMLVPIGINGLNSGQMVAIQVTKWGSGLASNTWIAFTNAFTDSPYVILPPTPAVAPMLQQVLKSLVCQTAYQRIALDIGETSDNTFNTGIEGWNNTDSSSQNMTKSWYYENSLVDGDRVHNLCGSISMLNPAYAPEGTAAQFLSSANGLDASFDVRRAILIAQRDAIDSVLQFSLENTDGDPNTPPEQTGSRLAKLANNIYKSADSFNTDYILKISDILEFNLAVGEYRAALATGIRNAIASSATLSGMSMTGDARSRGWLSAAVWFNTVAKINGMVIDYAKAIPSASFSMKVMMAPSLLERTNIALQTADDIYVQLPYIAANNGSSLNEPLSFVGSISTESPLDKYLGTLAQRIKSILGNTTASSDEIAGGTLPAFASGLALNTANPLAELSALGHRMVEAAFTANTALTQCDYAGSRSAAAKDPYGDAVSRASAGTPDDCKKYFETDPGTSMLISATTGSLVMAGITLAFILPLLPFIRFLFGILTWVIAVFETVIAIPVVALAHIRTDGEGLAGPMARSAYMLLLQVFLRPVLMVFGLMIALLVFNLMIVALNEFYSQAVRSAEGGGSVSALAAVVYSVVYVALAYGIANASFKAIDLVPSQCLMWIGGATQQTVDGSQYVSGAVSQTGQLTNQAMPAAISRANLAVEKGYYGRIS